MAGTTDSTICCLCRISFSGDHFRKAKAFIAIPEWYPTCCHSNTGAFLITLLWKFFKKKHGYVYRPGSLLGKLEVLASPQRSLQLSTFTFPKDLIFISDGLIPFSGSHWRQLEIEDWFGFVVVKVQGFLRKNSEINFRGLSHENSSS